MLGFVIKFTSVGSLNLFKEFAWNIEVIMHLDVPPS